MTKEQQPYNPLDKTNLGESVADAMLAKPVEPLPPAEAFEGAGIYAIYYVGDFSHYRAISKQNREDDFSAPIYVGKAIPQGGRKGGIGLGEKAGTVLYRRLVEHATSIQQAKNLAIKDFRCRYLVVDDIWIPLGESLLIQKFQPLWNHRVDGFGNHDPGGGRKGQQKSPWDVIHPGRPWADKLTGKPRSEKEILEEVKAFLSRPMPEETTIKKPK